MGTEVAITRHEHTSAELRQRARQSAGRVACRMLAIAHVLDGLSRTEAAQLCGMDRQTLRDWVHRYNAEGLKGLSSRTSPGRPATLSPEQMTKLKALVVAGPDPSKHGVVRWRCVDLQSVLSKEFDAVVHERTVGKLLHRLRLTRLQPRPHNPKQDLVAQEAFKKNFAALVAAALPERARGKPLEIWFQDKARVGQQGTLGAIWAEIGSCPPGVRDDRHDSAWLFGAVCPQRSVGAALVMPWVSSQAMTLHLDAVAAAIQPGAHAVLECDGAGWHRTGGRLVVPDNVTLLPLPGYAPELNPIENVWAYLRGNYLNISVWDTYDEIVSACCIAWNTFIADITRVATVTQRTWASVSL